MRRPSRHNHLVQGLGYRVYAVELRICSEFRVWGVEFRVYQRTQTNSVPSERVSLLLTRIFFGGGNTS